MTARPLAAGTPTHGLLPKAASSAMFAFWRQLTSTLRYNHASIAKVSLLLTSTARAVVATRADTCRTSNSIMSSLSDIFIAPVTSTSFFMVLLLLHYAMLVAYIWTGKRTGLVKHLKIHREKAIDN